MEHNLRISEAEATAVAMITAANACDDACALLATRLAFAPVDERVLISFCIVEVSWSWAPRTATSDHPVLGPTLRLLRCGNAGAVRSALVCAMTGKSPGSYAALLVQLAYAAVHLVPDIADRLRARGLAIAADPEAAANWPAGNGK